MDEIEKLKYELIDVNNGLLIKLRFACEINDEVFKQLDLIKSILKRITVIWSKENYLPKELCDIFVDFYPSIESCLSNYDKISADMVLAYVDGIMDQIRECCMINSTK